MDGDQPFNTNELDDLDLALIDRLMKRGRTTWADLAEALDVSAPAIAARVRRLEEKGAIRGYAALAAPDIFAPVCAFIAVSLAPGAERAGFREAIAAFDAVLECHRTASGDDYLLKARSVSLAALDEFVSERIGRIDGVQSVKSTIVMSTLKETTALPLPSAA